MCYIISEKRSIVGFSNINTVIFLINLPLNIDLEIYDVNLFVECSKEILFLTPNH